MGDQHARRAAAPVHKDFREFVRSHALGHLPADPLWVLDHLISGPTAVVDLWAGGDRAAVGVVVDTCENADDAAEFLVLAAGPGGLDADAVEAMLAAAEREAMAGPRANLEIALPPAIAFAEELLKLRSYREAYRVFDMEMPLPEAGGRRALPSGFRWEDLSAATVGRLYEAVRLAFAGVPGVSLPEADTFGESNLSHLPPVRLLFRGGELAGFARVKVASGATGHVDLIGRAPHLRGRGLGEHLLEEALRLLRGQGAAVARLQVVASNRRAIELYRSRGFALVHEQVVMSRRLRHGP